MKSLKRSVSNLIRSFGYELVPCSDKTELITPDPVTSLLCGTNLVEARICDCVDKLGINYEARHPWVVTVTQQISKNVAIVDAPASERFFRNWQFPLIEDVFGRHVQQDKIGRHFLRVFHGGAVFLPFSNVSLDSISDRIKQATQYLVSEGSAAGFSISIDEALNENGTWTRPHVEVELHRLWMLVKSIRDVGYKPSHQPDGDILVYGLRRSDELRFLVVSGYHRIAVLSALGFETTRVRLFCPQVLDATTVNSWPGVRQGIYSEAQALAYFNHLFDYAESHFSSSSRNS